MPREPEVHIERQGRPAVKVMADEERRSGLVVTTSSSLSLAYLASVILTIEGEVLTQGNNILYRS